MIAKEKSTRGHVKPKTRVSAMPLQETIQTAAKVLKLLHEVDLHPERTVAVRDAMVKIVRIIVTNDPEIERACEYVLLAYTLVSAER